MSFKVPPELHGHEPVRGPGVHFHQELKLSARHGSGSIRAEFPGPVIPLEVPRNQRGYQPPVRQLARLAEKPALARQKSVFNVQIGQDTIIVPFKMGKTHADTKKLRPLRIVGQDCLYDSRRSLETKGSHSPHAAGRLSVDFQFRWIIRSSPGNEGT